MWRNDLRSKCLANASQLLLRPGLTDFESRAHRHLSSFPTAVLSCKRSQVCVSAGPADFARSLCNLSLPRREATTVRVLSLARAVERFLGSILPDQVSSGETDPQSCPD